MTGKPHLTVFGFGVYVKISALLATGALILLWREVGAVIAVTIAGSILVHELGHSLAFRRYGTESHIAIHIFGGHSSPDEPHKLSHNEWVNTALAGPSLAFFLLGLPAWLLREFTDLQYLYPANVVLHMLVLFNIYWGAANLLPIWPLDGGRILFHLTEGNWQITKVATLVCSVPVAIVGYRLGYRIVVIFALMNAFQVLKSGAPQGLGVAANSRISDAVKRAKAFAPKPTKTRGAAGAEAVDRVYRDLITGRARMTEEPLAALRKSKHRQGAKTAASWGAFLTTGVRTADGSPLLAAVADGDIARAAAIAVEQPTSVEVAAAARALHQRDLLTSFCEGLVAHNDAGLDCLRELERHALDIGMVDEQIIVTKALRSVRPH